MSAHLLYPTPFDLVDLLGSGEPRPILKLLLTAKAKASGNDWAEAFCSRIEDLYRNFGEDTRISDKQRAVLERLATEPRGVFGFRRGGGSIRAKVGMSAYNRRNIPDPIKGDR